MILSLESGFASSVEVTSGFVVQLNLVTEIGIIKQVVVVVNTLNLVSAIPDLTVV